MQFFTKSWSTNQHRQLSDQCIYFLLSLAHLWFPYCRHAPRWVQLLSWEGTGMLSAPPSCWCAGPQILLPSSRTSRLDTFSLFASRSASSFKICSRFLTPSVSAASNIFRHFSVHPFHSRLDFPRPVLPLVVASRQRFDVIEPSLGRTDGVGVLRLFWDGCGRQNVDTKLGRLFRDCFGRPFGRPKHKHFSMRSRSVSPRHLAVFYVGVVCHEMGRRVLAPGAATCLTHTDSKSFPCRPDQGGTRSKRLGLMLKKSVRFSQPRRRHCLGQRLRVQLARQHHLLNRLEFLHRLTCACPDNAGHRMCTPQRRRTLACVQVVFDCAKVTFWTLG